MGSVVVGVEAPALVAVEDCAPGTDSGAIGSASGSAGATEACPTLGVVGVSALAPLWSDEVERVLRGGPGTALVLGIGVARLVESWRMSFPLTTVLSLLFLRSRVSISSPPASKSMIDPTRTLMTPKNPWSFFLNFFWSNICTAKILSSSALISKLSFQYGFSVLLMTVVVRVCSPLIVATAKGSGKRKTSRLYKVSAAMMVNLRFGPALLPEEFVLFSMVDRAGAMLTQSTATTQDVQHSSGLEATCRMPVVVPRTRASDQVQTAHSLVPDVAVAGD